MRRYRPLAETQVRLLTEWENRCAYCRLPFGVFVWPRRMGRFDPRGYYHPTSYAGIALRLEWDHFVPFTYSAANPETGFLPTCHLCNGLKADSMFRTIEGVREAIEPKWLARYELASGPVTSWQNAVELELADYEVSS
jgi:hypothetical protein